MEIDGQMTIPASVGDVWDALHQAEVLQQCIPTCKLVSGTAQEGFSATLSYKLGGMPLRLRCRLEVTDIVPQMHLRIEASGDNTLTRGAGCTIDVHLTATQGRETDLTYAARAVLNAGLRRALGDTADDFADKVSQMFFDRLSYAMAPARYSPSMG